MKFRIKLYADDGKKIADVEQDIHPSVPLAQAEELVAKLAVRVILARGEKRAADLMLAEMAQR